MAKNLCEICGIAPVSFSGSTRCDDCYTTEMPGVGDTAVMTTEMVQEILDKSKGVMCFTTHTPSTSKVLKELGIVVGTSSKQAFWGLSTQADRLTRAYEAALSDLRYEAVLLGANAIVGITFALNNSTGSSASFLAGSSEAVMLMGTAVFLSEK